MPLGCFILVFPFFLSYPSVIPSLSLRYPSYVLWEKYRFYSEFALILGRCGMGRAKAAWCPDNARCKDKCMSI